MENTNIIKALIDRVGKLQRILIDNIFKINRTTKLASFFKVRSNITQLIILQTVQHE